MNHRTSALQCRPAGQSDGSTTLQRDRLQPPGVSDAVAELVVIHFWMVMREHKKRSGTKVSIRIAIIFVLVAVMMVLHYAPPRSSVRPDRAFLEKLESAKHYKSQFPAQRQTIDLAKKSSVRHAALNAIGMELREVRGMATGSPEDVFAMLSHLGGFGEIIWVDQWTNFPVKLPPNPCNEPQPGWAVGLFGKISTRSVATAWRFRRGR